MKVLKRAEHKKMVKSMQKDAAKNLLHVILKNVLAVKFLMDDL